ncbi:kinocilin isoform X1 [Betta splendens]|uniref:Kinocilin isoform X1 n=1 Tax=Betta splendens TaxID=158456 RepID=A0A6P7L4T8_BETSP|nr:kinocilin isoform X1 [Betta splendens]XP_028988174.1 kinocilin isoform X1 [Betta splendens]
MIRTYRLYWYIHIHCLFMYHMYHHRLVPPHLLQPLSNRPFHTMVKQHDIGVAGVPSQNMTSGLLISIYPFIKAWLNINHILPSFGNFRVHPTPANPAPEQPIDALRREVTQSQLNLERSKSRMGTFVEGGPTAETNADEGTSSDMPDVLSRRKLKQSAAPQDLP